MPTTQLLMVALRAASQGPRSIHRLRQMQTNKRPARTIGGSRSTSQRYRPLAAGPLAGDRPVLRCGRTLRRMSMADPLDR